MIPYQLGHAAFDRENVLGLRSEGEVEPGPKPCYSTESLPAHIPRFPWGV
jgi:hypothetical protein